MCGVDMLSSGPGIVDDLAIIVNICHRVCVALQSWRSTCHMDGIQCNRRQTH